MRLLEREDLGDVRVLVADSSSNRVPASVEAPHPDGAAYHMPRFSEVRERTEDSRHTHTVPC